MAILIESFEVNTHRALPGVACLNYSFIVNPGFLKNRLTKQLQNGSTVHDRKFEGSSRQNKNKFLWLPHVN